MNELLQKKFLYTGRTVMVGDKDDDTVRQLLLAGVLTLVESKHTGLSAYRTSPPKPYEDKASTCTYKDCVTIELNRKEQIVVDVYDGDTVYGKAISGRARYTFEGDWTQVPTIAAAVENMFKTVTLLEVCDLEDQEREQRRQRYAEHKLATFKIEECD